MKKHNSIFPSTPCHSCHPPCHLTHLSPVTHPHVNPPSTQPSSHNPFHNPGSQLSAPTKVRLPPLPQPDCRSGPPLHPTLCFQIIIIVVIVVHGQGVAIIIVIVEIGNKVLISTMVLSITDITINSNICIKK